MGGIWFITFTCFQWKPLFELTNAYDAVYKWFDYLTEKKVAIIGYVIMPNHLHVLLNLPDSFKYISIVVTNSKRFLAYELIKCLGTQKAEHFLQELHSAVKKREQLKGQIHKVFIESFNAKECFNQEFIEQKLTYMHHNPVQGKWNLVNDFALNPHGSAGFYFGTYANVYK